MKDDALKNMHEGKLYFPDDEEVAKVQKNCLQKLFEYNSTSPAERDKREKLLKDMFGEIGKNCYIEPPFHANFGGRHCFFGSNVYANFNLTCVDDTFIYVGDNTMIGPNVTLCSAAHPVLPQLREKGYQYNMPVKIGKNCWLGAGVIVLPGVTIEDNTVIGAGSLVTKDIPANVVAYGSPCRVIRNIDERDKKYYYKDREIDKEKL